MPRQDSPHSRLRCLLRASLWLAALTVTAGAAVPDDLANLQARAARFWDARVRDDWKTVHGLLPPEEMAQAGDVDTFATYQRERGPIRYHRATIHEVVVDKDLGWVRVEFDSGPRLYPALEPTHVHTWHVWLKREDWRPVARSLLDQYPTRPPQARPADEEAVLVSRVHQAWKAQEASDWAALYELLDPAYRAATPREQFLARKARYLYLRHSIDWAEVTDDRGRVKIVFTRKLNDPTLYKLDPEDSTAFENWRKTDGQWFREMEPPKGSR